MFSFEKFIHCVKNLAFLLCIGPSIEFFKNGEVFCYMFLKKVFLLFDQNFALKTHVLLHRFSTGEITKKYTCTTQFLVLKTSYLNSGEQFHTFMFTILVLASENSFKILSDFLDKCLISKSLVLRQVIFTKQLIK